MRSKKRSAASSTSTPPSLPPLFIDRSLGKHIIPAALRQVGATVHVHDDQFAPDAPDKEWLKAAGTAGWVVITKDTKIRYREPERAALFAAAVRSFVITTADLQGPEMAAMIVQALPAMARLCGKLPAPFIARIGKGGKVQVLLRG